MLLRRPADSVRGGAHPQRPVRCPPAPPRPARAATSARRPRGRRQGRRDAPCLGPRRRLLASGARQESARRRRVHPGRQQRAWWRPSRFHLPGCHPSPPRRRAVRPALARRRSAAGSAACRRLLQVRHGLVHRAAGSVATAKRSGPARRRPRLLHRGRLAQDAAAGRWRQLQKRLPRRSSAQPAAMDRACRRRRAGGSSSVLKEALLASGRVRRARGAICCCRSCLLCRAPAGRAEWVEAQQRRAGARTGPAAAPGGRPAEGLRVPPMARDPASRRSGCGRRRSSSKQQRPGAARH